jgi:hypothetical protein
MEVPGHVTGLVNGSGTAVDAYSYEHRSVR